MIDPHHSRDLHEAYGGDKNFSTFNGQHCSPRPKYIHDSAVIFLSERLFVGEAKNVPMPIANDSALLGLSAWAGPNVSSFAAQSWLPAEDMNSADPMMQVRRAVHVLRHRDRPRQWCDISCAGTDGSRLA